jgi:hypothetical protein
MINAISQAQLTFGGLMQRVGAGITLSGLGKACSISLLSWCGMNVSVEGGSGE